MIGVNMKKISLLSILILVLILPGCRTFDMIFNPGDYIPRDTPREKEYIYDTIFVANAQGEMVSVAPEPKKAKQLVFDKVGESCTFKPGETIEVISDGVDFSQYTFDIETREDNEDITLTLVDKDVTRVILASKCQTIIRTGIEVVPKVEVAPGLKPEQIVCTPLFDDECQKIGYEIRYGSEERGCRKEARPNLIKFRDCAKEKPIKNSKNPKLLHKLALPPVK